MIADLWLAEEVVGQAVLGTLDECLDLVCLQDQYRTGGGGGLAQGDLAAGQFLGFEAGAAVGAAPWLLPAVVAQISGWRSVVYVLHVSTPCGSRAGFSRSYQRARPGYGAGRVLVRTRRPRAVCPGRRRWSCSRRRQCRAARRPGTAAGGTSRTWPGGGPPRTAVPAG